MKPINYMQFWTCKLDRLRNLISVDNFPTFFFSPQRETAYCAFGKFIGLNMSLYTQEYVDDNSPILKYSNKLTFNPKVN